MAFPTVESVTETTFNSDTTAHAVSMPATVNSGDLLLILFCNNGSTTVNTPSGWTQEKNQLLWNSVCRVSVYSKTAAGTEGGTTVDVTTTSSEQAAAQVYRVTGWSDVELSAGVVTGTQFPNPDALNPSGWGTEETLWIAVAAVSDGTAASSYPTSYTNGFSTESTGGTASERASIGSARRENSTASEDPGTFDYGVGLDTLAFTIGIRPDFQTIGPPLLTTTPTFYGPTLDSRALIVPLLNVSPTFNAPSFAYDQTVTAPLLSVSPTFNAHSFASGITAPLLTVSPTFYGINLAFSQNLTAPLLSNAPTLYGHEFFITWRDTDSITSGVWTDVDTPA